MTPFVVDRSRKALAKMVKRTNVSGVRRMDAHPTLSYYLTGASDGSIKLWEWGVHQPLFTARVAGQYAKVTKVVFSTNGNKFAAVDGDGLLCLWQASQSVAVRKPFFNQKCHQKTAADVKFLGQTSSVLVTAGHGTGDVNLALWDTLLPQNKAMVHSWVTHPDGATSLHYLPHSQTIISGGRHGEINIWDVRQRQIRTSIKAFEGTSVKCLAADPAGDLIIAGSNEGDIKVWSGDVVPTLLYSLPNEHAARGGFSLRQVGSSNLQGVQQLFVDSQLRLFSCGADYSLKFRTLPNIFNNHWM
uniref:WD_REPEATS_REGION domain-containing protein n=1 Tax=Steinernema glaseri TaxID=37863 RepID=A0A1I7ZN60_9BILA